MTTWRDEIDRYVRNMYRDGDNKAAVRKRFRELALRLHPNKGGNAEEFKKAQAAKEHIEQSLNAGSARETSGSAVSNSCSWTHPCPPPGSNASRETSRSGAGPSRPRSTPLKHAPRPRVFHMPALSYRTVIFNLGIVAAWGLVAAMSTPPPLPPPQSTLVIEELVSDDDDSA